MLFVPYIMFDGNAAEALSFYEKILGAQKPPEVMLYGDAEGMEIPPGYEDKVLHAELSFPGGMIYISDSFSGAEVSYTDSISFNLSPDSEEALKDLFEKLSEGGTVVQPLKEEFWGAIFGSLNDKFGIHWSLNYQLPQK